MSLTSVSNSWGESRLSDLTIIIPSFERQSYLLAQLEFWSRFPVHLIAVDGTPRAIPSEQLQELPSRVRYLHRPGSAITRITLAATLVDTAFVTMLADDDLHLPNALFDCVSLLQQSESLSACIGQPAQFCVSDSRGVAMSDRYSNWPTGLSSSDLKERFHRHFSPYVPTTVYGVIRTNIFRDVLSVISSGDHQVFAQSELEFEALVCASGQTCIIDRLHWLRSLSVPLSRPVEPLLDRENVFHQWWFDDRRSEWKLELVSRISAEVARVNGLSPVEASAIVSGALGTYSRENLAEPSLWKMCRDHVPVALRPILRRARDSMSFLGFRRKPVPPELYFSSLLTRGIRSSSEDLAHFTDYLAVLRRSTSRF